MRNNFPSLTLLLPAGDSECYVLKELAKRPPEARAREYRSRAEELKTIAEGMHDEECRVMTLAIAEGYETLARKMELLQLPDLVSNPSEQSSLVARAE